MKTRTFIKRAKRAYRHDFPHGDAWNKLSLEWKRVYYEVILYQRRHRYDPPIKAATGHGSFSGTAASIPFYSGTIEVFKTYDHVLTFDEIARDFQAMLRGK